MTISGAYYNKEEDFGILNFRDLGVSTAENAENKKYKQKKKKKSYGTEKYL
jgi:hypothetical protein